MAENILHFGAVKMRINGSGNLKMQMISLDNARTVDMLPLAMSETSGVQPMRRVNFLSQRAKFKGYTEKINEYARINRIVIYAKPKSTSYPM